jgi:probable biosynthetic protein (TIGR04099 family)
MTNIDCLEPSHGDLCGWLTDRHVNPMSSPPSDTIRLGMPHLSANGLSEGWLLKELGHRHWLMLADAADKAKPEFRDDRGERVYPAFCAVTITDGDFGAAKESDYLTVLSSQSRLSRTQIASRHGLAIDGRPIGHVEMISTFVRRKATGSNYAVARTAVDGLPPMVSDRYARRLGALAADFRTDRVAEYMGFHLSDSKPIASFTFDPCPSQDFNGAGFLYFTSFVAFVDRAEWQFDRSRAFTATTVRRDVFFRGNLDRGEAIRVVLLDAWHERCAFGHRCRLERPIDDAVLGDIFTIRTVSTT